jgi:hypothetical protein
MCLSKNRFIVPAKVDSVSSHGSAGSASADKQGEKKTKISPFAGMTLGGIWDALDFSGLGMVHNKFIFVIYHPDSIVLLNCLSPYCTVQLYCSSSGMPNLPFSAALQLFVSIVE